MASFQNMSVTGNLTVADPKNNVLTNAASGWTNMSLTSPFTNYSSGWVSGRYIKVGKIVYVEGLLSQSGVAAFGTIFTFPAGYRPPQTIYLRGLNNSNQRSTQLRIDTNGNFRVTTVSSSYVVNNSDYINNGWLSICCNFYAG